MIAADANIFNIERSSFVDGPGVRTVIFFKGCNLRCKWCHNPESWTVSPNILYFEKKCTKCGLCKLACSQSAIKDDFYVDYSKCIACGKCVNTCPNDARKSFGKKIPIQELFEIIETDKPFFDTSGGGVTFSGGECLLQIDVLEHLIDICNSHNISVAIDTAGNVPQSSFEKILDKIDWFLFDIKCINSDLHKKMTGVSNEQILSNYKYIHTHKPNSLIVRIPIIPGINDNEMELNSIHDFLSERPPKRVDILPYHRMGEPKQKALSVGNTFSIPNEEFIASLQKRFNSFALNQPSFSREEKSAPIFF